MLNKRNIFKTISNIPGWVTNRKIVVIESDDWGSIRMPSNKVFGVLQSKGLDLMSGDSGRYNKYDSLATYSDLSALFDVLSSVKDVNHNSAVFTAVCVTANPDFDKIRDSGYCQYFYEPFTKTLNQTSGCENSFDLWQQGISNKLFIPQFHGREHLNVDVWMRALQRGDKHALAAFDQKFWGYSNSHPLGISFQSAFDLEQLVDLENQKEVIASGLKLFEELIGYQATLFVPPNGPFNNELEKVSAQNGIKYMSASKVQYEPLGGGETRKRFHWLGLKNRSEQLYIVRNCVFEPSKSGIDWVDSCLKDVDIAFKCFKPAIIGTHRVNYIGALDEKNRDNGLIQLEKLLHAIVKKWPETIFLSSSELGKQM
jgi:hypothetical protein